MISKLWVYLMTWLERESVPDRRWQHNKTPQTRPWNKGIKRRSRRSRRRRRRRRRVYSFMCYFSKMKHIAHSGSGHFILCDMHSLMPVGFSHVVIYGLLFTRILLLLLLLLLSWLNVLWLKWMWDECTWHHEIFLVQSLYWHLAIKLYCIVL